MAFGMGFSPALLQAALRAPQGTPNAAPAMPTIQGALGAGGTPNPSANFAAQPGLSGVPLLGGVTNQLGGMLGGFGGGGLLQSLFRQPGALQQPPPAAPTGTPSLMQQALLPQGGPNVSPSLGALAMRPMMGALTMQPGGNSGPAPQAMQFQPWRPGLSFGGGLGLGGGFGFPIANLLRFGGPYRYS